MKNLIDLNTRTFYFYTLTAILLLTFFLRFRGLDWGLPAGDHVAATYRPDEYSLFSWLRRMRPAQGDFNPHIYFNGTLILFLLAISYKILSVIGILKVAASPVFYYAHVSEWAKFFWVGRLMMIFLGTLTVWIIAVAGSIAFGRKAGLAAALLMAIVPLHAVSSRHMLIEPVATLWVAMTILFAFKIIRERKWKDYLSASVVLGSAWAVKVNNAPLTFLILLAHFLAGNEKGELFFFDSFMNPKIWVSLLLAVFFYALFNPYLLFNFQEAASELQMWYHQYRHGWSRLGYGPLFSLTHLLPYGLGAWFLGWGVVSCLFAFFSKKKETWLLLFGLFLNFYLNARTGTTDVKYHVLLLPFFVLLSAAFFTQADSKSPFWIRWPVVLGFGWIIFKTLQLTCAYNHLFLNPDARDQASEWIQKEIPKGTSVGVLAEPYWFSPPVIFNQYFFTGRSLKWRIDSQYRIENFDYDLSKINSNRPAYVVLSSWENRILRRKSGDRAFNSDWSFLESFLQGQGYERLKTFQNVLPSNEPALRLDYPPDDWLQILSEVRIYRRRVPLAAGVTS